jgi:hypothetical protein
MNKFGGMTLCAVLMIAGSSDVHAASKPSAPPLVQLHMTCEKVAGYLKADEMLLADLTGLQKNLNVLHAEYPSSDLSNIQAWITLNRSQVQRDQKFNLKFKQALSCS